MASVVNLTWQGRDTLDAARAAVNGRQDVELQLPAGFHHAVLVHFHPSTKPGDAELDIRGGSEILARAAGIRGLDALGELQDPVRRAHAEVRIVSPSPKIVISAERVPHDAL